MDRVAVEWWRKCATVGLNVLHVAGTSLALAGGPKLRKQCSGQVVRESPDPDGMSDHLFTARRVQTDPSGEGSFIRGRGVR